MVSIKEFCDMKQFENILKNWSKCTGLAVAALDEDGKYIGERHNYTEFCSDMSYGNAEGRIRCDRCIREESGIYKCHAGLMEFNLPITLNDGTVLGKLIGGQVLTEEPDENSMRNTASELKTEQDRFIKSMKKVSVRNREEIDAAAELLSDTVNRFVRENYSNSSYVIMREKLAEALQEIRSANKSNKTINEISTNQKILAINASVEAAHAGRAGKGFSIVATEVDRLALMMENVSTEITDSLSKITTIIEDLSKM